MKYLLYFILFAFSIPGFGQELEIFPSKDMSFDHISTDNGHVSVVVKNNTGEMVDMKFQRLSYTFPDQWIAGVCAGIHCYVGIPSYGDLGLIEHGQGALLNFSMQFENLEGEGTVQIRVYDNDNESISDTFSITFRASDEITSVNLLKEKHKFIIGPNPTNGNVNIQSESIEEFDVLLFNSLGILIGRKEAILSSTSLNLTNNPAGIYYLKIRKEGVVVLSETLVKQ